MRVNPDIDIEVFEGVYAPSEDTYLLLHSIGDVAGLKVLEVGTGTGFIALHCASAGATVTATDISPLAVGNARRNAAKNNLRISVVRADLLHGLGGVFDLVIFNPPYLSADGADGLRSEDREQLVGGLGGHELAARFLDSVTERLSPEGKVLLLVSSESLSGLAKNLESFSTIELVSKRCFFEVLAVYELTPG